jgi:hypothetical protein
MGMFTLNFKKNEHYFIMFLVGISLVSEIITIICLTNTLSINCVYSVSFIVHQFIWLLFLSKNLTLRYKTNFLLFIFLLFSFVNLFFWEGLYELNYYTFILGSILYGILFCIEIAKQLREDNLDYFSSTKFIILFSPIIFQLGLSMVFAYRNQQLLWTTLFSEVNLYTFIIYILNISFYFLINFYIYLEYKKK